MDYEAYREAFFTEPQPEQRYHFHGLFGVSLFFEEYEAAVDYYTHVLGPPAYVEGDNTKGWKIGDAWLTLFPSVSGNPQNMDIQLALDSAEEANKLYSSLIDAGGEGKDPADVFMYDPVRIYPVTDPFGTNILIVART